MAIHQGLIADSPLKNIAPNQTSIEESRIRLVARCQASCIDIGATLVCSFYLAQIPYGQKTDAMDIELRDVRVWGYYVASFYHSERNHQGIQSKIINPDFKNSDQGASASNTRLGGLLNYYGSKAA